MDNNEKKYTLNIYNTCTGCYEDVEVSEEVYKEYKRSYWREKKNNQKHAYYEIPFSSLSTEDPETDVSDYYNEFESGELPVDVLVSLTDEVQKLLSLVSKTAARRIFLHFSYAYTYEQIASLENVSSETIKESIVEGMKKIRKSI